MNVFQIHDQIVSDYETYIRSFLKIADLEIKQVVETELVGTYRTKDTIVKIYDDLAESQRTGRPYVSRLNPPVGPPTDEHGHFNPVSQWDPNHWPSHIYPPRDPEGQPIPLAAQESADKAKKNGLESEVG